MDGEPAEPMSSERLPWPGEETVESRRGRRARRDAVDGPAAGLRLGRLSPLSSERTSAALRRARGSRRRERPGRPGRHRHLPGRACRDRARNRARGVPRRREARDRCSTAISISARRRSSSGRRRSSAGRPRTSSISTTRAYDERPALVSLTGNPDPDLLGDLDAALVGRSEPKELRVASLALIGAQRVNWTIVSAPNEGWATQVFGEPDMERLWDAVATATRLDAEDIVAAWQEHADDARRPGPKR